MGKYWLEFGSSPYLENDVILNIGRVVNTLFLFFFIISVVSVYYCLLSHFIVCAVFLSNGRSNYYIIGYKQRIMKLYLINKTKPNLIHEDYSAFPSLK